MGEPTITLEDVLAPLGFIPPNPNLKTQAERAVNFRNHLKSLTPPTSSADTIQRIDDFTSWFCNQLKIWTDESEDELVQRFTTFGELGVVVLAALVRVYVENENNVELLKQPNVQQSILEIAQKIAQKNATDALKIRESLELIEEEHFTRFDPNLFAVTPNHLLQVIPHQIARAINQPDQSKERGCPALVTFKVILEKLINVLND